MQKNSLILTSRPSKLLTKNVTQHAGVLGHTPGCMPNTRRQKTYLAYAKAVAESGLAGRTDARTHACMDGQKIYENRPRV